MNNNYDETFFSKLNFDLQEKLYLAYMKSSLKDRLLIFSKLKYGDEITFKELSEKMHFSAVRNIYTDFINTVKSGIMEEV